MYIGIHCIDSWHLANGIHCPNLSTYTADDIDTLLKYMKLRIEDCVAEDKDYNPRVRITPEYIKQRCEENNGNCHIYFVKLTVYGVDDSDFDDVTIKAKWMKK